MRLAASRNSFLRSPVGSGPGVCGIALTAAVVSRARARADRAARLSSSVPERLATSAGDPRLELVQLGQHRDDLAHVVGVEDGELGLERRLLLLDRGQAVAQPLRLALRRGGRGEQLASAGAGRHVHRADDDARGRLAVLSCSSRCDALDS